MRRGIITITDLWKSYDTLPVLCSINLELASGHTYCLMGPSGGGKTTLLRILLGLESADRGTVSADPSLRLTAVFQEDRLCETFSPIENIMMASGSAYKKEHIFQEACRLLPRESLTRPVSTLSGGMKRRVAILRALLAPSDGILMDEPFTGLDEDTKQTVIEYIKEKSAGKLLLVTTHQEEDIAVLGGEPISLTASKP